jgi:FtsZ-binding cell division protein ZapB
MEIKELIEKYEKKRTEIQTIRNDIIDLKYEIQNFCESKIGWVVEQFGEKYYIVS